MVVEPSVVQASTAVNQNVEPVEQTPKSSSQASVQPANQPVVQAANQSIVQDTTPQTIKQTQTLYPTQTQSQTQAQNQIPSNVNPYYQIDSPFSQGKQVIIDS